MDTKVISSGVRYSRLPESYVRPESKRPRLSEFSDCENVPLIDLGCEDRPSLVQQIGDSCEKSGFFQVSNHGVGLETVGRMTDVAVEEKLKLYSDDPAKTLRLSTSFNVNKEKVHNWRDLPEWLPNPPQFNPSSSNQNLINLLSSVEDAHGGVTVEMKEPMDSKLFASMLGSSLSYWIQQKKRGVWIKLPIQCSNLVYPAVKEGFLYDHAKPDYLMLVKRIPETSDTLPSNASHRVGIGGFVMNNEGELLVVQDRNGGFKGTHVWNLPTGTVDEYMEVDRTDIFSKILTETDIKARLAIPTPALKHINMHEGVNYVYPKDSDGKKWPFQCYTRPTGHPKPAFTTGWLDFVKAKGLQIGDKVTFRKLEDEDEAGGEPQYIIHAKRPRAITLMGKQIIVGWLDLPLP
ncbi:hypothetical protein LWI29_024483 [Acer saccharum]|uniref:TF-B3 domain-containing protein n=1 Tax=Acer saccharum TaxID=4024 RepID=A0AA39VY49_ACESA|nr:hypothetical protein LWI29_024483 [Acer saccharum]